MQCQWIINESPHNIPTLIMEVHTLAIHICYYVLKLDLLCAFSDFKNLCQHRLISFASIEHLTPIPTRFATIKVPTPLSIGDFGVMVLTLN